MRSTLPLTVLVSDEASIVELGAGGFSATRDMVFGQGWAKKHPKDSSDQEIGYDLALSRALRDLAEKLEARAYEKINNPRVYVEFGMDPMDPNFEDMSAFFSNAIAKGSA